jgi:hypothetical protein
MRPIHCHSQQILACITHHDLLINLVDADMGITTHIPLVAKRAELTCRGHPRRNNLV